MKLTIVLTSRFISAQKYNSESSHGTRAHIYLLFIDLIHLELALLKAELGLTVTGAM